jgi:hypothetical protein
MFFPRSTRAGVNALPVSQIGVRVTVSGKTYPKDTLPYPSLVPRPRLPQCAHRQYGPYHDPHGGHPRGGHPRARRRPALVDGVLYMLISHI